MRREHFEHVIAAAANVVGEDEFVVIGSQAILGADRDAPEALLRSMEVDIYPAESPGLADKIDGALGDGSPFHRSFGYYAHGVGPETAKAPLGWRDRLVRVEIPARLNSPQRPVACCLEPHDLVLSKCVAGRDRDWQFARDALAARLVEVRTLRERTGGLPIGPDAQRHIRQMLGSSLIAAARGELAGLDVEPTEDLRRAARDEEVAVEDRRWEADQR